MSLYQFEFRAYYRPFKQPLRTHHGLWRVREGLILRLTDTATGQQGWGEIAPIAAFGSESLEQAMALCQSLSNPITLEAIAHIPAAFPACRFGLGAAYESATDRAGTHRDAPSHSAYSHLLPTGDAALQAWKHPWQKGTRTFKWKIGAAPIAQELPIFEQLIQQLPDNTRLRLDANGGLEEEHAHQWLQQCDRWHSQSPTRSIIEFIEQPLPPHQFPSLLSLSQQYQTPIALDESIATIEQLQTCYEQGWQGLYVIKAAIAGFPWQIRSLCQQYPIEVVWSSVLETAIARQFIQRYLIAALPSSDRAIGFGIEHWFAPSPLDETNVEQLWQSLSPSGNNA